MILLSCDSNQRKCDYFKGLLPSVNSSYAIVKININCEQCLLDLDEISASKTTKVFFITSTNKISLVKEKVTSFNDSRLIVIEDEDVIKYFEKAFVNTYPTYYTFNDDCVLNETSLSKLID